MATKTIRVRVETAASIDEMRRARSAATQRDYTTADALVEMLGDKTKRKKKPTQAKSTDGKG